MKYKLRNSYTTDPDFAIQEILSDRGVKDIDLFLNPSKECELNWHNLDNIIQGRDMLLSHLNKDSNIFILIDSD